MLNIYHTAGQILSRELVKSLFLSENKSLIQRMRLDRKCDQSRWTNMLLFYTKIVQDNIYHSEKHSGLLNLTKGESIHSIFTDDTGPEFRNRLNCRRKYIEVTYVFHRLEGVSGF